MTEPTTLERADCEACGKNVAVNKDGGLRKHECVADPAPGHEPDAAGEEEEQPVVEPLPELPPLPADPEPEPEPALTQPVRVMARRRYCRVPNCGRSPEPNGLCTSHRLHHGLIE